MCANYKKVFIGFVSKVRFVDKRSYLSQEFERILPKKEPKKIIEVWDSKSKVNVRLWEFFLIGYYNRIFHFPAFRKAQ